MDIKKKDKPYNDEKKILTARRLKELRESKRDEKGRKFSHATLANKISEKYGHSSISDKSLLYYEITDTEHSKYTVGEGMKIETLFMLADYYGVSCDYLLGREENQEASITQARIDMGLSVEAAEVLRQLNAKGSRFVGRPDMLETINHLIETLNILIETGGYTEHISTGEPTGGNSLQATGQVYQDGLINHINDFLRFTCPPQPIEAINILAGKKIKIPYTLDDEVLSDLLLMEINKELMELRKQIQQKNTDKDEGDEKND